MTEARAAAQKANAKHPKVQLPAEVRSLLAQKKAFAINVLTTKGFGHIVRMVEQGPGDEKEQRERFTWACDFIGDRCGLSKRHETAFETEGLPPIVVQWQGFKRPTDS